MKTAIIIGATSGIGYEVATRLVEEDWRVAVAGRRTELLERMRKRFGEKVLPYHMDVTLPESVNVVDEILSKTGAPDLFLYVSGVGSQNRGLDEQVEINTVQTNSEGMVRLVSHWFNYVKLSKDYTPKRKAHIAVVTSVAGTEGLGLSPAYSSTKKMQSTYITALAQLASMEKVPVRFTDIRPGFVATDILNPNKKYPMLMKKEKVAELIVKGLKRRRRVLIIDWRYRLLVAFWRLIPRCLWERITWAHN